MSDAGIELSSQLDIIIYDAVKHAPLVRLQTCDVMPLESVYAYIEVKATIRSSSDQAVAPADDSIEACIAKNRKLRKMRTRWFTAPELGSPSTFRTGSMPWIAIRSFIVAFEPVGTVAQNPDAFASRIADVLGGGADAHIHGVFVPEHGFFYTRGVNPEAANADDLHHVVYTTDRPMLAFKTWLLRALSTFDRPPDNWTAAVHRYYSHNPQWIEKTPTKKTDPTGDS